tara:strand:+ start:73 stop:324 length:252 start_codon:yes stop_codon:yes gene_type:complete
MLVQGRLGFPNQSQLSAMARSPQSLIHLEVQHQHEQIELNVNKNGFTLLSLLGLHKKPATFSESIILTLYLHVKMHVKSTNSQ